MQIPSNTRKKVERVTSEYGGVAQLGEHLPCKQGVMGSNPIISTKDDTNHVPPRDYNGL